MAEQMAKPVGRGAIEEAPNHKIYNLCLLAPARVPFASHCILLRRTYLGLQKVARLESASGDGRRQLLRKRLNIFVALPCELLFVLDLCCLVFTDHSRVEQLPKVNIKLTC